MPDTPLKLLMLANWPWLDAEVPVLLKLLTAVPVWPWLVAALPDSDGALAAEAGCPWLDETDPRTARDEATALVCAELVATVVT